MERRPLVSSVSVCTPTGVPDCRGPCQDCPDYCQPVQQSWCELEHTVSTRISQREVQQEECGRSDNTADGQYPVLSPTRYSGKYEIPVKIVVDFSPIRSKFLTFLKNSSKV